MAEWDEDQKEKRIKRIKLGVGLLVLAGVGGVMIYFYSGWQYKKNIRRLLEETAAIDQIVRLPRRGTERMFDSITPSEDEWFLFYSADQEQARDAMKLTSLLPQKPLTDKINEIEEHHARKTYDAFTAIQEEFYQGDLNELMLDYSTALATAKTELNRLLKKYPGPANDHESSLYAIRFAIQSHDDALKNIKQTIAAQPVSDETFERLTSWRLALFAGKKAHERIMEGL